MNDIRILKAEFTEDIVNQLIELSRIWVEEDISYGMVVNTKDDLNEPCFIALENNKVVGYIFGHFYNQEKKNSLIKPDSKCFDIDELYVLKEYRSKGIGRKLFKSLEDEVKDKADFITLATPTKDYKKTLKFYIEDEAMSYYSAYLIKKTK